MFLFLVGLLCGEIKLVYERALHSCAPIYREGPNHLSAASGLCKVDGDLLIVPDDGTDLFVDSASGSTVFPLLQRAALPRGHVERKEVKPDFESLARIGEDFLTVGSGSTASRARGVVFRYRSKFGPSQIQEFDLSPLYQDLRATIPQLNIEGLAALEELGVLRLAHRGKTSMLIDLNLPQALTAARQGKPWTPDMLLAITSVELGLLDNVPLGITDLTPISQRRCAFSAAAEATDDPVDDGEVIGSTVGVLSAQGEVITMARLDRPVKVEGIAAEEKPGGLQLFLVTDADDPELPAQLFSAHLPLSKDSSHRLQHRLQ